MYEAATDCSKKHSNHELVDMICSKLSNLPAWTCMGLQRCHNRLLKPALMP